MLGFIKGMDLFGGSIGVNYKGEDTYKTIAGGILTFLATVLVLFYAVVQAEQLITRSSPQISVTHQFEDYATSTEAYNLSENELGVIIQFQVFSDNGVQSFDSIDPKYGRIAAYKVTSS